MDIEVFNKKLSMLTEVYGKVSEDRATVYYLTLGDLTEKQFHTGIVRLLQEREFTNFPTPAEIRKYALGLKDEDIKTRIDIAKQKLRRAISTYGAYQTVAFDDPGIHAVIDSIDARWYGICTMSLDNYKNFFEFTFDRVYRAFLQSPYQVNTSFIGIHDKENREGNLIVVGDKKKFLNWSGKIRGLPDLLSGPSEKYHAIEAKSNRDITKIQKVSEIKLQI